MPIYAFQCAECGHAFDKLQKLSDPDPETCPTCGVSAVKRQLTAPSFRLSGSGWYETDFKKDGDKKRNLTDGSEGAGKDGAGKPETKTGDEAKPAAAPKEAASAPKTESKPEVKPAAPTAAPSSPST